MAFEVGDLVERVRGRARGGHSGRVAPPKGKPFRVAEVLPPHPKHGQQGLVLRGWDGAWRAPLFEKITKAEGTFGDWLKAPSLTEETAHG